MHLEDFLCWPNIFGFVLQQQAAAVGEAVLQQLPNRRQQHLL
jgi:hypothetical protein